MSFDDIEAADAERRSREATEISEAEELGLVLRWIPVGERLPPDGERVLVTWADYVEIASWDERGFWDWDAEHRGETPTHWMRLPSAPEGE